ncbi:MAG: hypothetical protein CVT61_06215 [Actinobacteria bacterium HGW-Actinobacteria-11]|nr:MAG: hypothetical protein CVT61_06215 [Actinobacteria bacterium HGW-Actinobacteria-11]
MLIAFLDTTALHKSYLLAGAQWDSVEHAVSQGTLRVAVADVSVEEIARQASSDAREVTKKLRAAIRDGHRFGVHLPFADIPDDAATWKATFERNLASRGITVVPHAQPLHRDVLRRDLESAAPFKSNGEGYRDTLIWLTFLAWVQRLAPEADDVIVFVSDNTTQFSADRGETLHPSLVAEVRAITDATVRLVPKRSDFVESAREHAKAGAAVRNSLSRPAISSLVEEAATVAANRLWGSEFDILGRLELEGVGVATEIVLPDVSEASIDWVEPLLDRIEATHVDTFDEVTELWSATVEAVLSVEGMVHKGDYPGLSEFVEVRDGDWNTHYMWVSFEVSVQLRYDVRVEQGDESVHAELVEATILRGSDDWLEE